MLFHAAPMVYKSKERKPSTERRKQKPQGRKVKKFLVRDLDFSMA
jgi:hypothetical protein